MERVAPQPGPGRILHPPNKYSAPVLERKARFITQVMHGRLDSREITDIGDATLSFSEVKALATGNPLLMDKAEADATMARLERAERAHLRNQDALRYAIAGHHDTITTLTGRAADIDAAIARRVDTRGDKFTMTVGGREHAKRVDAGQHLKQVVEQQIGQLDGSRGRMGPVGELGGFPLTTGVERVLGTTSVRLALDGAPDAEVQIAARDLRDADPVTLITRLEHRLTRLEERKAATIADVEHARREIRHAQTSIGQPFPHAAELTAARERVRQIDGQLQQMTAPPQAQAKDAAPGQQPPPGEATAPRAAAPSARWAPASEPGTGPEPPAAREMPRARPDSPTADWRADLHTTERRAWQPRPIQAHDAFPAQRHIDEPETGG